MKTSLALVGRALRSCTLFVFALGALLPFVNSARSATVTVNDSIVLLSTRSTNYTFTDVSGKSVVIAVSMTVYSTDPLDVFTKLDGNTRLGVGNPTNGGDGNWFDTGEGANFNASLVSASSGVLTNSLRFRIASIGTRAFADIFWNSSACSNSFNLGNGTDVSQTYDTNTASLSGTNYLGQLRLSGQFQLTDAGPLAGHGITLEATFSTVTNTAPTLTSVDGVYGGTEDTALAITYTKLESPSDAADADGDAISFRVESILSGTLTQDGTNVVVGSTLLSTNGSNWVWTPPTNVNGMVPAFTVKAWDGALASSTAVEVDVSVAAVNDAPVVVNPIPVQSATYGTFFSYVVPTNTFYDPDSVLSYFFSGSEAYTFPNWASFDSGTLAITGTPTSAGTFGAVVAGYDGNLGAYPDFVVNVAKAALSVTPADVTRAYGQSNPTLTGSISGIKNSDTITATYSTTATAASVAGTYPITAILSDPNGRLGNYTVTTNQGTLTITNVPVVYVADPHTNSWLTNTSGRYVRIYKTKTDQTSGISSTTWSNGFNQATPVYAGVQEVYSSTNWVYVRSSGLGSHVMGPWYFDANKTQIFSPWPINQKTMFRIPRTPTVATTKTVTAINAIGWFVDGVAMFDDEDSYFWNGTTETNNGTGYWFRDAFTNEYPSFDPNNAHQEQTGMHHYHANPPALRYLLGDNVLFNSASKTYSENTTNLNIQHSPILGWMRDGYPLYGPYGYSVATDASSSVRRMISGFVLRNGQSNTDNLTTTGRTGLPAWAARVYNTTTNHTGPSVTTQYFLGRYLEDYAYMGDLGYTQAVQFDLDEYNGRYCVTPEFPNGTYAYFCSIQSNGTPKMPYNIGRAYYGVPTGGTATTISETVVTNFLGGTNLASIINKPTVQGSTVTLTWSAIEGGKYEVDASTNLSTWPAAATNVSPNQMVGGYTNVSAFDKRFYRVARTSVATNDSVGTTLFTTTSFAPGGTATRGTTVTVTITLPDSPPQPPATAVPTSVTLAGTITGTLISRPSQTTVEATFTIPANASTGTQNIVVTFSPGPVYTITGLTIN